MNYIIDPLSLKSTYLFSEQGKNLLKKYINEYNKSGGSNNNIEEHCKNKINETIVNEKKACKIENYSDLDMIPKSIDYVLKKKFENTDTGRENAIKISEEVYAFLEDNQNIFDNFLVDGNTKYITILGPLEDIIGFFIKKRDKDEKYKYFNVLSVEDNVLVSKVKLSTFH